MDLSTRLSSVSNRLTAVEARQYSANPNDILFSAIGEAVLFGCRVTQGTSASDMIIALEGQAAGDTAKWNPNYSASPTRGFEYANIASGKDGAIRLQDTTATVDPVPATGTARVDIAYIYVGRSGAGFGIAVGTPSIAVKTDFDSFGLDTAAYGEARLADPALPVGALPVGRVYVSDTVTGIPNSRIADIRPTSTNGVTTLTITQPAAGITVTNSGIAQSGAAAFTFALSGDLAALEGLATTGLAIRSGTSTWLTRSIASANSKISVSNADGVSGNPTLTINEANFTGIPQSAVTSLTTNLSAKQPNIQWQDEGSNIGTSGQPTTVNFVGAGVTAAHSSGTVTVTIPGGGGGGQSSIQFKDEGTNIGTLGAITEINFTGAGVTASHATNVITVNIPGSSGQAAIQFQEEGSNVGSSGAITTLNVVGSTLTASVVSTTLTLTSTAQQAIQFQDEGLGQGASGGVSTINFVGAGVNATHSSGSLTVTIPGSSGPVLLLTVTANNTSGTVTLGSGIDTTYSKYLIEIDGVTVTNASTAVSAQLNIGGTYQTTGYDGRINLTNGASVTSSTGILLTGTAGSEALNNTSTAKLSASVRFDNPTNTSFRHTMMIDSVFRSTTGPDSIRGIGAGSNSSAGTLTGVRFVTSSGNFVAGTFKLYGWN